MNTELYAEHLDRLIGLYKVDSVDDGEAMMKICCCRLAALLVDDVAARRAIQLTGRDMVEPLIVDTTFDCVSEQSSACDNLEALLAWVTNELLSLEFREFDGDLYAGRMSILMIGLMQDYGMPIKICGRSTQVPSAKARTELLTWLDAEFRDRLSGKYSLEGNGSLYNCLD